ncbi:hypothetical protein KDH_21590 [Dictyobacter sp. S3.2.2.5]|uniref:Uncharacterized protein n=1 Tax=Dictyobacter halimunensis TaxID=3026934 RepID=A0ABQ6FPU0_9CHLR|nr:hypothetical protein KDH_21590 [Dictyobacter sp. S3.2.2.5]
MLTTKNTLKNDSLRASEEKRNLQQDRAQAQQLLPQGLLPLEDEQISRLLALVAVENYKILRLSLLESV